MGEYMNHWHDQLDLARLTDGNHLDGKTTSYSIWTEIWIIFFPKGIRILTKGKEGKILTRVPLMLFNLHDNLLRRYLVGVVNAHGVCLGERLHIIGVGPDLTLDPTEPWGQILQPIVSDSVNHGNDIS